MLESGEEEVGGSGDGGGLDSRQRSPWWRMLLRMAWRVMTG